MTDIRESSEQPYSETDSLLLHVAVCFKCRQSADDDGGEYQITPEKAVEHVLKYHGWTRYSDGLLCDECRI